MRDVLSFSGVAKEAGEVPAQRGYSGLIKGAEITSRLGVRRRRLGWVSDMEARGVDGDPARGAAKQERDRAEDKFTVGSHDKKSETTRYCWSDYFRGR